MTIRQELKRRAARALAGFACAIPIGLAIIVSPLVLDERLRSTHDPRAGSPGLFVLFIASTLTGGATFLAGPIHAYLLGRGICCGSTWDLLRLGPELGKMKCCPYCGRPLDDRLPERGPKKKPGAKRDGWEDELA